MTDDERQETRRLVDDAALDAALSRWARGTGVEAAGEGAALLRIVAHGDALAAAGPARTISRWGPRLAGAALAASVALALVLVPRPARGPSLPEDGAGAGEASFALLFTPVPEEEMPL